MQYSRCGRTRTLYSERTTFSDLKSKILPMKPTNSLEVLTTLEQCLPGLRSLLIVTPKSFSMSTFGISVPFVEKFVRLLLLPICKTLRLFTLYSICHLFYHLTRRSRSDRNSAFTAMVVTLPVIFVSSANFDILQVRPSSMSFA